MHYPLLAPTFFVFLVGIFIVVVVLIEIRVLRYAYLRIGVSSRVALFLLFSSLVGSYINVPVAHFPDRVVRSGQRLHPVVVKRRGTVIDVNVGGAVIPALLSLYLLYANHAWVRGFIATAIMAAIMHMLATPVRGVGIAIPILVPSVATAIVAVLMARQNAAALAYVSGSLGTLIGADLLNLSAVRELGAPVASIGGAGTFDAIFLTGIIAVLLASFSVEPLRERRDRRRGRSQS
jgi:uncharacterized membrane protein